MEEFKSFLERNKPQSESSSEFLAYYALPYIPDPRNNFTYVNLFKPEWTACIIEQIEKCVEYYSPNKVCNLPLLYDISMGKKRKIFNRRKKWKRKRILFIYKRFNI